ncbi:MAG: hypothetical protein JKY89_12800 [Immundisolibacteraceae bacterium]|nr:hypothetical protein [Immundisolibacteraceae bacterium]
MPIQLKWPNHGHGVEFIGTGIVTGTECIETNQIVVSDPRLAELAYQIVDLSGVEKFDVTVAETRTLAEMDEQATDIVKGVRVAMVCPDDLVFGMSRVYAGHSSADWQTRVFRTRTEAEVWLGSSKA